MMNAKDSHPGTKPHRILGLGDAGGGKSTQIITLPRPCFVYFFDPNGLNSIQGQDVDYEEWLPGHLPMAAFSLSKERQEGKQGRAGSTAYEEWERDFDVKAKAGFFEPYKTICIDSCTTLLELIMDRILTINGRPGQFPLQDDYGPQMVTFMNIMRTLTQLNKTVYVTGHLRTDKDEVLGRIIRLPLVTGQLREKLPLLFSDVLVFYAETDTQTRKAEWLVQTTPDKMTPRIRTAIRGLEPIETMTINWKESVLGQGLGGILNWEKKQLGLT
jgi:hypothetical protein